ncbi:MAG: RnfABCDGE type electron transport complex subunit D [Candidatus Omnitrophota bacterium]|nr:RnfABCDGE type electron transport complex subunit D [Candidatus Omnitrophota bacterium]
MGKLIVSSSPHIRSKESINRIMWSTAAALMPAVGMGLYVFGLANLSNIIVSISVAVLTEAVCQKMMRRRVTIDDGSAVLTGLLLIMVLPPGLSWWMVAIGSFFAIAIVKQLFGGLGYNIFNPALAARAALLASFPIQMTRWLKPFDSLTTATPLDVLKHDLSIELPSLWNLFIGKAGGCLGERSVLALLIGAGFLFLRKIISWHVPFSYIGVVGLLSWIFGRDPLFSILAGGLILGAFFMATDPVTTPLTKKGQLIFGTGCGIITVVIRQWGGYPEGVCYSILLMNALTPLIDRYIKPKRLGIKK